MYRSYSERMTLRLREGITFRLRGSVVSLLGRYAVACLKNGMANLKTSEKTALKFVIDGVALRSNVFAERGNGDVKRVRFVRL